MIADATLPRVLEVKWRGDAVLPVPDRSNPSVDAVRACYLVTTVADAYVMHFVGHGEEEGWCRLGG